MVSESFSIRLLKNKLKCKREKRNQTENLVLANTNKDQGKPSHHQHVPQDREQRKVLLMGGL